MRLLLDTHVLLWWLGEPDKLTSAALDAIADGRHEVLVSAATVWEAGIKQALGKLDGADGLLDQVLREGMTELPISGRHAERAAALPPHHQDPFDRLLVAQAQLDDLTLCTRDPRMSSYGIAVLVA